MITSAGRRVAYVCCIKATLLLHGLLFISKDLTMSTTKGSCLCGATAYQYTGEPIATVRRSTIRSRVLLTRAGHLPLSLVQKVDGIYLPDISIHSGGQIHLHGWRAEDVGVFT